MLHGRLCSLGEGRRGRILHILVAHNVGGQLGLGFLETSRCVSVQCVDLHEDQDVRGGSDNEADCCQQDEYSGHQTLDAFLRKHVDEEYDATETGVGEADRLNAIDYYLTKEYEEEEHEVDRAVASESFVRWPEPANIR